MAAQIGFGRVTFNAEVISNAAHLSGLGREGGTERVAEYTTTQYVGIADPYVG